MPAEGTPLFSIVIACFNAAAHLAEALDSVLEQGDQSYEVVVADGGSTDDTLAILGDYEPRFGGRLQWKSEPDKGIYDAMNKALARARGDYVVFLGADDRLAPGALALVADIVGQPEPPDIVAGAVRVFGPDGAWLEPAEDFRAPGRIPKRAPSRHQSTYVRRDCLVGLGGFDLRFRIASDYEMYVRLAEAGASLVMTEALLSEFRLGGLSSSDAFATARDYRDVRLAHGAKPLVEQLRMYRSGLAAWAVAHLRRASAAGKQVAS